MVEQYHRFSFTAAVILLSFNLHAQLAGSGTPDSTFGINGFMKYDFNSDGDWGMDMAIQPDDMIVTSGPTHFAKYDDLTCRFRYDGNYDPTFNNGGCISSNLEDVTVGNTVLLQPDGKILSSAVFNPDSQYIFRYLNNGMPDSSFDGDGIAAIDSIISFNPAKCLAIQPDGKILYGGSNPNHGIVTNPNWQTIIVRLFEDGSIDTSFGINGYANVNSANSDFYFKGLTLLDNGQMMILAMKISNGKDRVYRLNNDGSIDCSFHDTGYLTLAKSGLIQPQQLPDGKWIRVGNISQNIYITRLLPDFVTDSLFGVDGSLVYDLPGNNEEMEDFILDEDGSILVTGKVDDPTTNFLIFLCKFKSDGTPDSSFSNDGFTTNDSELNALAQRLAIDNEGKIVITGLAQDITGYYMFLTRYNNASDIPTLIDNTGQHQVNVSIFPNPFFESCNFKIENFTPAIAGELILEDQLGRVVKNISFHGNSFKLYRENLFDGIYSFNVLSEEGNMIISSGKIIVSSR